MDDQLVAKLGRAFETDTVLFREGERGDEMYVVQSGRIRITKQIADQHQVLAVLGPGEFLGEMAILNGKPRTATATCAEETTCLVIKARTLEQMVANNAEIAMRLIKKLAKRLDSADTLIEILMHRDPKARVMLAVARHAEAFGESVSDGWLIRLTNDDIAREVAVPEDVVSDVLARLSRVRIALRTEAGIVVRDVGRLRDFLELLEMPSKFAATDTST